MLSYIVGAILTLLGVGTIIFKIMKGSVAADIAGNQQTQAKVINIQTGIVQDQNALAAQQAARDQAAADLKAKEALSATQQELVDFANNSNKPNS